MSTTSDEDNVIFVHFGPGGGRRVEPAPAPPTEPDAERPASAQRRAREPYGELFSRAEIARLFQIPEGRLRYWDRSGFLKPSGRVGRRRFYTFQDVISVRAAHGLLAQGAPLPVVRRGLESLARTLPHVTRPLNELRVTTVSGTMVVREQDRAFDAATGQLQLDFDVRELRDDVLRVLRPRGPDPEQRRRAYQHYLEGCRLDEDESTFDHAERCYEQAFALDPGLANALTNWGNLRFRRGAVEDAEQLYVRALAIDPEQPEALYNLGFLAFERGGHDDAAKFFARAVVLDPGFADAHFNLAMAYEELGRSREARPHWARYLELDPKGPWADIARRHLGR
ncbi:MAG: tetratricopeptide repeat protein [Sandaracinaceae bacterium]